MRSFFRKPPRFWYQAPGLYAALLSPLAAIYGAVSGKRMAKPHRYRAKVPVICVGNFVTGGAGKTPVALALAELIRTYRVMPVFLTRGYGGSQTGPLFIAPTVHSSHEVGDEALLLAQSAPTLLSRDRAVGGSIAERRGGIIIMDDGLQNPDLYKDFTFAVIDGATGLGNGCVMPAGPLRAPLEKQFELIDALVVVGQQTNAVKKVAALAKVKGLPVFHARVEPSEEAPLLEGKTVVAFAGIGQPKKFFDYLEKQGCDVVERISFPDHHSFTHMDAKRLLSRVNRYEGALLLTTSKDLARLTGQRDWALAELKARAQSFPVEIVFDEQDDLLELIRNLLRPA